MKLFLHQTNSETIFNDVLDAKTDDHRRERLDFLFSFNVNCKPKLRYTRKYENWGGRSW